jgi:hypothetical protein
MVGVTQLGPNWVILTAIYGVFWPITRHMWGSLPANCVSPKWALTQSHIPLRELCPFRAAKIMAVMRLVRGYRRPYLLLGSGIWANISSRLCPEGTGSMAPPPPSLHREAARPRSSQAAPWLYFSHPVRFTPSSGRAGPWQSTPSLYLLIGFSPIIPNSQKTGKPWAGTLPVVSRDSFRYPYVC